MVQIKAFEKYCLVQVLEVMMTYEQDWLHVAKGDYKVRFRAKRQHFENAKRKQLGKDILS